MPGSNVWGLGSTGFIMHRLIAIGTFIRWTLLTILLGGAGLHTTSAQDAAPYLYYFHPDVNAWVIERADGKDSRLLGQGLSDENTNAAEGSWSYSGKWFAWMTRYITGPSPGNPKWYAVSTDGLHAVNMNEQLRNVEFIQWAAKSNYLFVEQGWDPYQYYLVDVPNEQILWSQIVIESSHQYVDGEMVGDYFVYWDYEETDMALQRNSIKILSLTTGVVISLPHDPLSQEQYMQFVDPKLVNRRYLKVNLKDQTSLFILDIVNGDLLEINPNGMPIPRYLGEYFQWSSDGQYALIALNRICPNVLKECADLWLVSPQQRLIQHVADNIVFTKGFWVPAEPLAILAAEDGLLSVFDARSGLIQPIAGAKASLPLRWVTAGDILFFAAGQDLQSFNEASISEAGLLTQLHLPIDDHYRIDEFNPNDLQLSPNGRYVGLGNTQAIYDFETKAVFQLPPHSGATYGDRKYAYYKWDSDNEWLIAGQVSSFMDSVGLYRNMVFRTDGNDRRELNTLGGQIEWLPEHVIPHLPPAETDNMLPQPHLTLEHPGYVTAAAWNQTGKRLAVAVYDTQLYIWSFEKAEPKIEQVIPTGGVCGFGVYSCQIDWSNDERFISLGVIPRHEYYQTTYYSLIDVESGTVLGSSDYPFEWGEDGFLISSPNYPFTRAETATHTAEYLERGEATGIVVVREKATQQFLVEFPIVGKVTGLEWVANGEHLLVQTDCSLQAWDISDGLIGTFQPSEYCGSLSLVASSNGRWAATESVYGPSQVYGFGLNKPPRSLNWYAKSVSFTPDNCWLTAAGTQLVTIWKLSDLIPDESTTSDKCMPLVSGTYKAAS